MRVSAGEDDSITVCGKEIKIYAFQMQTISMGRVKG